MLSIFRTKKSLLEKKKYLEAERLLRHVKDSVSQKKLSQALGGKDDISEAEKVSELDYEPVRKKALELISDRSWKVRNIGVKILGEIRCKEGVERLCAFLTDNREAGFVRRNSARALGMIGASTPLVIDALLRSVDNPYWEIRTEAIKAIGILGGRNKELEVTLLKRLFGKKFKEIFVKNGSRRAKYSERNFEVREAIAENLGRVGVSRDAVSALEYLLNDDIWMVRSKALNSLSMILDYDKEEFKSIISKIDLTCESFVPVFPLKETYSNIIAGNKEKK